VDITLFAGDEAKHTTVPGIYKLEDDRLVLAMPLTDQQERPATFDADEGIAQFTLARVKAEPGDARPAKARAHEPEMLADQSKLAGRWELITEKNANGKTVIEFNLAKKVLAFESDGRGLIFGNYHTKATVPLYVGREVPKGSVAVLEKVDAQTKKLTWQQVRFYFRGDVLEMFGEVRPNLFADINLTGRWKRVDDARDARKDKKIQKP
jgi:hypothetical protein